MKVVGNEIDAVVVVTIVVTYVVFRGLDAYTVSVVMSLSILVVEIEVIAIVVTGVVIEVDATDIVVTVEAVEVPKVL